MPLFGKKLSLQQQLDILLANPSKSLDHQSDIRKVLEKIKKAGQRITVKSFNTCVGDRLHNWAAYNTLREFGETDFPLPPEHIRLMINDAQWHLLSRCVMDGRLQPTQAQLEHVSLLDNTKGPSLGELLEYAATTKGLTLTDKLMEPVEHREDWRTLFIAYSLGYKAKPELMTKLVPQLRGGKDVELLWNVVRAAAMNGHLFPREILYNFLSQDVQDEQGNVRGINLYVAIALINAGTPSDPSLLDFVVGWRDRPGAGTLIRLLKKGH